ncbi:MAG: DUF3179 domain-containing protein [Deltaproteobacteria bacterium]|nr:DUF3179 domain-containing protein [Deltaproteobacteria bacterium]
MNIYKKTIILFVLLSLIGFCASASAFTKVKKPDNRIYIQDRHGEKWDVTQAAGLGFKPENFQYGIGRNAIVPVDDKKLRSNGFFASSDMRVIGIAKDDEAHAYSVSKLRRHEIANSVIADTPIAVGY